MLAKAKLSFHLFALFVALSGTAAPEPMPNYPQARRDPALDDYNGVKVADSYRWMEQLDSAETRDWVRAEAQLTDSYLGGITIRQSIKERLTELLNFEKFGMPF